MGNKKSGMDRRKNRLFVRRSTLSKHLELRIRMRSQYVYITLLSRSFKQKWLKNHPFSHGGFPERDLGAVFLKIPEKPFA